MYNTTMAFTRSPSLLLLLPVLLLLVLVVSSHAGSIAVYWGTNSAEGSLADTCNSGLYQYVMLAHLSAFGDRRSFGDGVQPVLDFSGHCNATGGGCVGLSADIEACQAKGVKVFLSIGGPVPGYLLTSTADARNLADYLWENFLSGSSRSRPLGPAIVDGIDFDIEWGSTQHYDELARALTGKKGKKVVLLSAAPQGCLFPDQYLDAAAKTGLFDYVWVRVYPPCVDEDGGPAVNPQGVWTQWTDMPVKQVFWGVSASPVSGGIYTPPNILVSLWPLPAIKVSPKYGGIMVWNRYTDLQSGYSSAVKGKV